MLRWWYDVFRRLWRTDISIHVVPPFN
ncbi:hypothetical protein MED222_04840 [Vibrio sp. MED222]|nr:hypothetical protein MED222_04840 [Vibrio sp. MED222]